MFAIYKRELSSYFKSPVGYIAFALFAFLSGYIFVTSFMGGAINLSTEIGSLTSFFVIIIPVITMSLFSEDKKRGTEVLYYTLPVRISSVVIGKFLAAMTLMAILFVNILIQMIVTASMGGVIDIGVWGSVLVFFFMSAVFISMGILASALTDNQIISAIVTFVLILLVQLISTISSLASTAVSTVASKLFSIDNTDKLTSISDAVKNGINWLDPFTKTANFKYGVFSIIPIIYLISLAVIFLFITYRILEKKRWTQA